MALFKRKEQSSPMVKPNIWARPEMEVVFRAEIMPGRSREQRTFRVKEFLGNNRVTLYDFPDEHRQSEFEPINFLRNKSR